MHTGELLCCLPDAQHTALELKCFSGCVCVCRHLFHTRPHPKAEKDVSVTDHVTSCQDRRKSSEERWKVRRTDGATLTQAEKHTGTGLVYGTQVTVLVSKCQC